MTNPAWTGLTIHAKAVPLGTWTRPRAEINGHPIQLNWGANYIPASPGVHQIHLYTPWMWRYGKANITVDNTSAPAPPVYYATPYATFLDGAVGFEPVKNPGLLALLLMIVVPFVLLLACCVGVNLLAN